MTLSLVVLALLMVLPSRPLVSLLRTASVVAAIVFAAHGAWEPALGGVSAAVFATAALLLRDAYLRAGRAGRAAPARHRAA